MHVWIWKEEEGGERERPAEPKLFLVAPEDGRSSSHTALGQHVVQDDHLSKCHIIEVVILVLHSILKPLSTVLFSDDLTMS